MGEMTDAQDVQQAVSWNFFALFWTLLLYLLQQIGLLYYLGRNTPSLLFVVAGDAIIFLIFVTNNKSEYAAREGGTCWVLYTWALSVKMVFFYFIIFDNETEQRGLVFPGPLGAVFDVNLLISLATAIYALLAFRASEALFGGISSFSAESMLHTDLVTHVVMDIIDLVAAFHSFCLLPLAITQQHNWLHLLPGIFIPLALFLHGYSFPSSGPMTMSGSQASSHDSGDVFTIRKHAALVGILLVDFPLLSLRLFTWAYYPTYEGFSPFLFKNICFIPIQFGRIRHCSVAAELKLRRRQSIVPPVAPVTFSNVPALPSRPLMKSGRVVDGGGVDPPFSFSDRVQTDMMHPHGILKKSGIANIPSPEKKDQRTSTAVHVEQSSRRRSSTKGWKRFIAKIFRPRAPREQLAYSSDEDTDEYDASISRLIETCRDVTSVERRLPARGFAIRRVLQKLSYSIRQLGDRQSVAMLLDCTLRVTFWKQLRIAFPFMVTWVCKIALVSCLFFFYSESSAFPIQLFDFDSMKMGWFTWSKFTTEIQVCLIIIAANTAIIFFLWIFAAPFLDVLFIAIFGGLRLLSFFLLVLTFRDFAVFDDLLQLKTLGLIPDVGRYLIFIFAVEPAVGLLCSLYPFICVLLGREYLTYQVPTPYTKDKSRGAQQQAKRQGHLNFAQSRERARADESGQIPSISLMVFKNCLHMLAPFTFHQLLIGPNLVKGFRLSEALLCSHWTKLSVTFLVRVWCIILYFAFPQSLGFPATHPRTEMIINHYRDVGDKWYERFSFASCVFLADVALVAVYLVIGQVVRLLSMRRFENKAMFRDFATLTLKCKEEKRLYDAGLVLLPGSGRVHVNREVERIVNKYSTHCFFTFPGDIIPPFL